MKKAKTARKPGARKRYDLLGGVRGEHVKHEAEELQVVLLEPDVAKAFPDSDSVNDALRAIAAIVRRQSVRRKGAKAKTAR